jgi:hypothetical protein
MKRVLQTSTKLMAGLLLAAVSALPQAPSISARPGAINYIEGRAALNGQELPARASGPTFLNENDTLSTFTGKAEILLTPGVFLRIGDNSDIRMISPSLIKTQVELGRGEATVEVAQLVKGNDIQILTHEAFIKLEKPGLYRIAATGIPTAAVIDGKATVFNGNRTLELGKGRQTVIAENMKAEKFDVKAQDDLFAWSNVRSQYNAEASYSTAQAFAAGYPYGPGWLWSAGFNSWAWFPGTGYAYSPFGWGFFGPRYVGFAPFYYGRGFYGYRSARVYAPVNAAAFHSAAGMHAGFGHGGRR